MMTITKTTAQLQFGGEPYILLQSTCTTTYQVTTDTCETVYTGINGPHYQQATCFGKNFEEIIFMVEVKSTKTVKFIVLENFPLYGSMETSRLRG